MSGRFNTSLRSLQTGLRKLPKSGEYERFTYEINIDWQEVAQMAVRAAASKGNKSQSGPIQVRIIKRQPFKMGDR